MDLEHTFQVPQITTDVTMEGGGEGEWNTKQKRTTAEEF